MTVASIHQQSQQGIRFRVDEVKTAQKLLPTVSLYPRLTKQLQTDILAISHPHHFKVIEAASTHPLAGAVHHAFSHHYPLLLTPDIIWITIAQGFAEHINQHAEALRSRFVRRSKKKELIVKADIPSEAAHWATAIQAWALLIRDEVGAEFYQTLECNFTTTTPITQTVSRVVMMETFRQYFDYSLQGICGIPNLTILGTVEDWERIYERVQALGQYELEWWTQRLLPICEEFIQAVSGTPNLEFWRSIYKPQRTYGTELITGWLTDLFPYIEASWIQSQPRLVRNPILAIERSQLSIDDGLAARLLPLGQSRVGIKLITEGSEQALELIAGFIGVNQHSKWQVLKPVVGWAVLKRDPIT